jgi:hypothetical protein
MMQCQTFFRVVEVVNSFVNRNNPMIRRIEVINILQKLFEGKMLLKSRMQDYATLQEQICALFFTNTVVKIDSAFFIDFLIVLVSRKVEKQQKITLMLKIIQDCLTSAKTGKAEVVRVASQRMFDLTMKTMEEGDKL